VRLEWSIPAKTDRDEIFTYVEADNPRAAISVDKRIGKQVGRLARFPELGRFGRVEGTLELVIPGTPYIVAYRIMGDSARILRVLHGARRWSVDVSEEGEG